MIPKPNVIATRYPAPTLSAHMDASETTEVYVASPAERRTFGVVLANGHKNNIGTRAIVSIL